MVGGGGWLGVALKGRRGLLSKIDLQVVGEREYD